MREYLVLGLRFGRVVDGYVDSYTGDPVLRQRVADQPRPRPAQLLDETRRLRAAVPDAGLCGHRRRFLDAQLSALECSARRLQGEEIPYAEEVRALFQTEVAPGDHDVYRGAHAELHEVLPGRGPLAERLAAVRAHDRIRPERLRRCVSALSGALRRETRHVFTLPPQESVDYRLVSGQPWGGLHSYLGDYRSRVLLSADAEHRMSGLPHLLAHEAYPGHHTQHCRSDTGEHAIFLLNTPQCLVSEGLADLGLHTLIGPGWGAWAAEIFADTGMAMDGELAERVDRITSRLRTVRQDAALMLHGGRHDADEVLDHLQRWLLVPRVRAQRMLDFIRHPLWRAYTTTYVEGYRLVSCYLSGGDARARYLGLLDRPPAPADLRERLSGTIPT